MIGGEEHRAIGEYYERCSSRTVDVHGLPSGAHSDTLKMRIVRDKASSVATEDQLIVMAGEPFFMRQTPSCEAYSPATGK